MPRLVGSYQDHWCNFEKMPSQFQEFLQTKPQIWTPVDLDPHSQISIRHLRGELRLVQKDDFIVFFYLFMSTLTFVFPLNRIITTFYKQSHNTKTYKISTIKHLNKGAGLPYEMQVPWASSFHLDFWDPSLPRVFCVLYILSVWLLILSPTWCQMILGRRKFDTSTDLW